MFKLTSTMLAASMATAVFLYSVNASAVAAEPASDSATAKLSKIIAARGDDQKARDGSRHPQQTLEFFGVKPGMLVAEVLPGGGWYTQILAPYIGKEGALYAITYADDMWPMFGFFNEEAIAKRKASMVAFPATVEEMAGEKITSAGFAFGQVPQDLKGKLDLVVMTRAMHNLNRFEAAGMRTQALADVHGLLKAGGVVGVVQHRAPAEAGDEWANGSNGYLKQAAVISMFEKAGFELIASAEINANAKDKPTEKDYVWRLPPSLRVAENSEETKALMRAIGESDRMTLTFRKK